MNIIKKGARGGLQFALTLSFADKLELAWGEGMVFWAGESVWFAEVHNDNDNSWGDIDDPGYRATYTANDRYDRAGDQAPESDIVRLSCQRNRPT